VKMPDKIEKSMLAPCGMDCMVCYKHVGIRPNGKPCGGCLKSDEGKPGHCRKCEIKDCSLGKGVERCADCVGFPCKLSKIWKRATQKDTG